jgi:ATP-binding cassette subfamily B protein
MSDSASRSSGTNPGEGRSSIPPPTPDSDRQSSTSDPEASPLRRLLTYVRPHRAQVIRASVYSVSNKVFDLAPPFLIGAAVNVVSRDSPGWMEPLGGNTPRQQLIVLAVLTIIIWVLESVFEYLYQTQWRNLAQTVQHEIRVDTYDHLQHLDHQYFQKHPTGDLIATLNDDVNQLERFLDNGANQLIQVTTVVLFVGTTFMIMAPQVAWWAFLPIPVILVGSIRFQKLLEGRYRSVRDLSGLIGSQLANNLMGIATIQSFTAEGAERDRMANLSERYATANSRAIKLSSAFSPLIRMAILVGFTATLVYGGLQTLDGNMSPGTFSVMLYMTQRLLWPLTYLGETLDQYQRAMASTVRILGILDTTPDITDGAEPLTLERGGGTVRFENVSFAYEAGREALFDVSFEIPAGETVAIVGPTGSGKSTLIKLLLRFRDPDSGQISIDAHAIDRYKLHDLRSSCGLVAQDVFLFHGTAAENIAYGNPGASREEIMRASETAEADEFIRRLPQGYDTVVGERGERLSGGQRQRIALARAFLKNPPILLLDEATSAVDNETEAAIQRSLARVSTNRTTLVIAHRLSTVRHAHLIHVLDGGRITESGTHDQLVQLGGVYAALWAVQTGEAFSELLKDFDQI